MAYLWVYTVLAILVRPSWPAIDRAASRVLKGAGLLILPALLLGLYRATAGQAWGETHIVWADAYGHLQYGTAFLLGLTLARIDEAWSYLQRVRTGLALGAAALLAVKIALWDVSFPAGETVFAFVREAYAWLAICALFGYARRYIRSGSPLLTTLTEAVFPFYIIHQTTIVVAGHLLKPLGLPVLVDAGTILALTVASCVAAYALARAVPILRLPLGLKPVPPRTARAPSIVPAE